MMQKSLVGSMGLLVGVCLFGVLLADIAQATEVISIESLLNDFQAATALVEKTGKQLVNPCDTFSGPSVSTVRRND